MDNLVRDALEVLIVVAVGGMLWSAVMRMRRGQIHAYRCVDCRRPISRVYDACPFCGTRQPD